MPANAEGMSTSPALVTTTAALNTQATGTASSSGMRAQESWIRKAVRLAAKSYSCSAIQTTRDISLDQNTRFRRL